MTTGPRLVTLATDIGWPYAAQMKAVLYRTLGRAPVVDLAHDLPRHGIREAAFLLRWMAGEFPAGSIHVVVVDPGVGGERAAVAVQTADGSMLVGPDNGVLVPLAQHLGSPAAYRIDRRRVAAPHSGASRTFDGRDLFAPAAAALAGGRRPRDLGRPIPLRPLPLARPTRASGGAEGEVVHVDHFGNLVTNIPTCWLPPGTRRLSVRLGRQAWRPVPAVPTYEAIPRRGLLAVVGSSFGTLEVTARERSAATTVSAGTGATVRLRWAAASGARRPQERK